MYDVQLSIGFGATQINQAVNSAMSQIRRAAGGGRQVEFALGRITGQANEFQKSLDASTARVVAFGATAGVLHNVSAAFKSLLSSSIDVEQALAEINSLLNLNSKELATFSAKLFSIANQTGQSFLDAAKAAQEFSRQGLNVEATLSRTHAALTLTRLSGLALTESVSSLTAALNSFYKEALSAEEIVNRMANVDAKFAVSSADMAEALKRVAGSAADAGVSFNEVIALVTAAQQATARGGSVIGNSFKTIFTRLQRPAVLDDLESMGIAIKKANGENESLINVLKNVAHTYDSLSSSQKSFVSETVGGVYQINVLKAVLNDLGNGYSNFQGALDAASESTAAAEVRARKLNETLASQLTRTTNNLVKSFTDMSQIVIEPTIKGGLKSFDKILGLADFGFSNEESEGIGKNLAKGVITGFGKGISNIISGPGVQFAVFGLIKLFQKLSQFVLDSVKDLTGINSKQKERAALEKVVAELLVKEKALLEEIKTGTLNVADATSLIIARLKNELALRREISAYTPIIATSLESQGVKGTAANHAAKGYIPNLNAAAIMESQGASFGGYKSGKVISTSISNGMKNMPIIANTAETKSSVVVGGKRYEWVNPPKSSVAGMRHAFESKRRTGINPYSLGQSSLFASGFIPNLSNDDDFVRPQDPPVKPGKVGRSAIVDMFMMRLEEEQEGHGDIFEKEFYNKKKLSARPDDYEPNTLGNLGGILTSKGFGGYYQDPINNRLNAHGSNIVAQIAAILGKKDKATKTLSENFDPADIARMLSLRGREFVAFSGFKDFATKKLVEKSSEAEGKVRIGDKVYSVPFRTTGLKNPMPIYEVFKNKHHGVLQAMEAALSGDFSNNIEVSNEATTFGSNLNDILKSRAVKLGMSVGQGNNDNLDILSSHPEFSALFHDLKGDYAGGDVKGSLTGDTPDSMASKIARVLAFKRGAGKLNIPTFKNVAQFTGKNAGLISHSFFGDRGLFEKTAYSALSTGKPIKVQIGSIGSGRDSLALSKGASPIVSRADIPNFDEYIINLDTQNPENVFKGITGLSIASASSIVGFNRSQDQIIEQLLSTAKSPHSLDARDPESLIGKAKTLKIFPGITNYEGVFNLLKDKLKEKFSYGSAGFIPNLNNQIGGMRFNEIMEFLSGRNLNKSRGGINLSKNDFADALDYLSRSHTELNKDMHDGSFGGAFPFGRKKISSIAELLKRKGFSFKDLQNAVSRENSATGGNAIVSHSPKLISSSNPFGLAAIDKRNQSNADDAISQHLMLGQSMSEIKKASSAKGFIPNLVADQSNQIAFSAFLAAFQSFQDLSSITKNLGSVMKSVIFPFSKAQRAKEVELATQGKVVDAQKKWVAQFESSLNKLREGKSVNDFKDFGSSGPAKTYFNKENFIADFQDGVSKAGKDIQDYTDKITSQKNQVRKFGFGLSIGSGLAGGIASTTAARAFGSPDLADSIDQITGGVQIAGQALASFPDKIGKSIALFSLFNSGLSATTSFFRGLEGARKALEIQESSNQKLAAAIQSVSVSLSNLNQMALDSSVSLDVLTKEQRNYEDALIKIRSMSGGDKIADSIETEPSLEGKIRKLASAQTAQEKDFEQKSNLFQIRELGSERSLGIRGTSLNFSRQSGGIFGGASETDRERALSVVKNNAIGIYSSMTEDERKSLSANNKNADLGKFEEIVKKNLFGGRVLTEISDEGGTKNDTRLIIEQLRAIVNNNLLSKSPAVKSAREEAIKSNGVAQDNLDNAIRNETAYKRQFLNVGVLRGTNALDLGKFNFQESLNRGSIANERMKAQSGQVGLLFGDKTVAAHSAQIELNRLTQDTSSKLGNVKDSASRKILEALSVNVDTLAKPADSGKRTDLDEINIPRVRDEKLNQIEGLSRGLAETARGGFSRFAKNGVLDSKSLESEVVRNSGGDNSTKEALGKFLASHRGELDLVKITQGLNVEQLQQLQEANSELKKQTLIYEELKKEMDLKRALSFLGGIKNLTDRNSRRENERKIIRGGRLMDSGPTPEVRARGAALFAEGMKDGGYEFDLNNPLHRKLQGKIAEGLAYTQNESANRVARNLSNGGAKDSLTMFRGYVSDKNFKNAPSLQAQNFLRPEDFKFTKDVNKNLSDTNNSFDNSLSKAQKSIVGFAESLQGLGDLVKAATKNAEVERKNQQTAQNQNQEKVGNAEKEAAKTLEGSRTSSDVAKLQKNNINTTPFLQSTSGIVGAALLYGGTKFLGKTKIAQSASDKAVGLFDKTVSKGGNFVKDIVGGTKNYYSRRRAIGKGEMLGPDTTLFEYEQTKRDALVRPYGSSGPIVTPEPRGIKGYLTFPKPKPNLRETDFIKARNEEMRNENLGKRINNRGLSKILALDIQGALSFDPNKQHNSKAVSPAEIQARRNLRAKELRAQRAQRTFRSGGGSIAAGGLNMIGGIIASNLSDSPLAYLGETVATDLLANQTSSLGGLKGLKALGKTSAGAALSASPLLSLAATAGTAYGGFKLGGAAYRGLNSDDFNIDEGLNSANSNTYKLAIKDLKAGKSSDSIKKQILGQINSDKQILSNQFNRDGVWNKVKTFSSGMGKEEESVKQSIAANEKLLASIDALSESFKEQNSQKDFQNKMLEALTKISNGGNTDGKPVSIKVEVSLKDADKLPETFSKKVVEPLQQQLQSLASRTLNVEKRVGVEPAPSSIG